MLQRIYVRLAIIALVLVSFAANAEDQVAAAEQSTLSWLALLDEAAYDASWDASASMFQERVTRAGPFSLFPTK